MAAVRFCMEGQLRMDGAKHNLEWKTIKRSTVYQDKWIHLEASQCELPNGRMIEPFYVTHTGDFALIVAVTREGEILLERQYRHGVGRVLTEVPAGAIEPGELPETAARRELLEETGYEAGSLEFLFKIAPNATSSSTYAWCYLARDTVFSGEQKLDATEALEVFLAPVSQVREMLRNGEFIQAVHTAALYKALEVLDEKNEAGVK